jgi:hypothetical protein
LRLSRKRAGSPEARPTPSLAPALLTRPSRRPCFWLDEVDGGAAGFGVGELGFEEVAAEVLLLHLGEEALDVVRGAADDDGDGALVEAGAGDGFTDSGAASGDGDDAIFEAEVHRLLAELL